VGAVLNLTNLVGLGQSSPEQQILAELDGLRNQVDNLRTEMHERFDRIDAGLNEIFQVLVTNFQSVNFKVDNINANLDSVSRRLATTQAAIYEVSVRVDRIERLLSVYFADSANDTVSEYTDRCLQNPRMTERRPFPECESYFLRRGTQQAVTDTASVGPPLNQRQFGDKDLVTELEYPLEKNITYISHFLYDNVSDSIPALTNVANPVDWATAAAAYYRLAVENPAQGVASRAGAAQLINVGANVRETLASLSEVAGNGKITGNYDLWTNLIERYRKNADALMGKLQERQQSFIKDSAKGVPLWLGLDYDEGTVPPAQNFMFKCTGGPYTGRGPDLEAIGKLYLPSDIMTLTPQRVRLAQRLGLGTVDWCYDLADTDKPVANRRSNITVTATYNASAAPELDRANAASFVIFKRSIQSEKEHLCCYWVTTLWQAGFVADWAQTELPIKDLFVTKSTLEPSSDAKYDGKLVEQDVQKTMLTLRQKLYLDLRLSVSPAGYVTTTEPAGELRDYLLALEGTRMLIESSISLGFPRTMRTNDLLRTLTFGGPSGERLVGEREVLAALDAGRQDQASSFNKDVLDDLRKLIGTLADALKQVVVTTLDDISRGYYRESLPMLERVMDQLGTLEAVPLRRPRRCRRQAKQHKTKAEPVIAAGLGTGEKRVRRI